MSAKAKSKPGKIVMVLMVDIRPAPENNRLYKPVNPNAPENVELAADVRKHGILEPLVLSSDRVILSGHRRHAAAKAAESSRSPRHPTRFSSPAKPRPTCWGSASALLRIG